LGERHWGTESRKTKLETDPWGSLGENHSNVPQEKTGTEEWGSAQVIGLIDIPDWHSTGKMGREGILS